MIKDGDCISLVSELLNINNYEAAKSINETMGLGLNFKQTTFIEINKYKIKKDTQKTFNQWEKETFQLLCDYLHLIWKMEKEENPNSNLYAEAMHDRDYIDYLIDEVFINGTLEDKIWFRKNNKKLVSRIKRKLKI